MIPEIELMESEHYTPVDVCHTQAAACLTISSQYTAGGEGELFMTQ